MRTDRLLARLGVPAAVVLALAGQYLLGRKDLGDLRGLIPGVALYLLAAGLLLAALWRERIVEGAGGPDPGAAGPGEVLLTPRALPPWLERSLVVVLLLGGLDLRLQQIDLIPRGLNNDEAID